MRAFLEGTGMWMGRLSKAHRPSRCHGHHQSAEGPHRTNKQRGMDPLRLPEQELPSSALGHRHSRFSGPWTGLGLTPSAPCCYSPGCPGSPAGRRGFWAPSASSHVSQSLIITLSIATPALLLGRTPVKFLTRKAVSSRVQPHPCSTTSRGNLTPSTYSGKGTLSAATGPLSNARTMQTPGAPGQRTPSQPDTIPPF